jgi:rhamnogalacturonyl hydrolase YesR
MKLFVALCILLSSISAHTQQVKTSIIANTGADSESYQSVTFNGSWCWFSDPRAVYYEGQHQRTYMGWIDNWGDVVVGYYDHRTTTIHSHVVAQNIEVDDHNNPSLFFDEKGHLIVTYNLHMMADMPLFLVRAKKPEDISEWEDTRVLRFNDIELYPELENNAKHCYTNPIKLSEENGKVYLFWRGHDGKPTFTTSTDNGLTWDTGKVYFLPDPTYSFRRPYTKKYSTGKDKIHFVFTDGHPRNEKHNSIYYAAYRQGAFYKANGEMITDMTELPMSPEQTDIVYDASQTGIKAWNWDIAEDINGHPVIAYVTFPDDSTHVYWYARWDGKKWLNYELVNSGNWFPETPAGKTEREPNYSGGMSIDKEDPTILYLSIKRDSVFEIEKWTRSKSGRSWKIEHITKGSSKDNVRPFAVRNANAENPVQVLWMQNTRYIHFHATHVTQWYDRFHSSIKMDVPSPRVNNPLSSEGITNLMVRVADWQLANPTRQDQWKRTIHLLDWHYAAFFVGLMDLYDLTGADRYRREMYNIGQHYQWKTLDEILHADRIAIIDMFVRLYEIHKDPQLIEKARWALDIIMSRGTDKKVMVNFENNVYFNEWLTWCDALFMSPPVFTLMSKITGDRKYEEYMNTMWWKTSDHLYSQQDSLYYRDDRYIGKTSENGKKIFWSRGNGWVIAGIARILKVLPEDSPYRPRLEQQFKEMAYKLLDLQQPHGLWTVSLLDPEYLPMGESSGSAFFTYALAYGINTGLITDKHRQQVEKAWLALSANVNQNGRLGYVQQIAGDPYPFYDHQFHVYASGAYLMAGKEMIKLLESNPATLQP